MGKGRIESRRRRGARIPPLPALIVALAAALVAVAILVARPRSFDVGLCGIDASVAERIMPAIDEWGRSTRVEVKYRSIGFEDLDEGALRGVDALFLHPSIGAREKAGLFSAIGPELSSLVARPLRDSVSAGGRDWALPLLIDTRELAWREDVAGIGSAAGRTRPSGLLALPRAIAGGATATIAAAGGDDSELVDIAGLFVADRGGLASYERLAGILLRSGTPSSALDADLGGFTLDTALGPLASLQGRGLLHPNWLELRRADLSGIVDARLAAWSLQTLSLRRTIRRDSLSSWRSAAISLESPKGLPVVTASVIALARPRSSRSAEVFDRLCRRLSSTEGQRRLQLATGLAPAPAGVTAVDVQAADARAAASGATVVQGLALDAFPSAERRGEFAAALRDRLRARAAEGRKP